VGFVHNEKAHSIGDGKQAAIDELVVSKSLR
jgi:hypothetical protein